MLTCDLNYVVNTIIRIEESSNGKAGHRVSVMEQCNQTGKDKYERPNTPHVETEINQTEYNYVAC